MEERAQSNPGRISKADFLKAISGPFHRAFTHENITKSFEKTGTWPIDRSRITPEMTAASEGLSGKGLPIVSLNSPVKKTVQLFDELLALHSQSQVPASSSPCSLPAPLNESLPDDSAPSPSSSSINSLFDDLEGTRAAFLFNGSAPSSANAIPPIDFHVPTPPNLSYLPKTTLQLGEMTKSALIDHVLGLQHDIELLSNHSEVLTDLTRPMGAQLALMALENRNLRSGLFLKEERKKSARAQLFPGGRGVEVTSDVFMDMQKSMQAEKVQKRAETVKRQAELAARKKIWEAQKVEYERKRQGLAERGFAMARAGPPPLLMNVVLEHSTGQSDMGSNRPVNKRNVRKGKGRQCRISIDPMLAKYLDIDDTGSDQESDPWSAHDESDE